MPLTYSIGLLVLFFLLLVGEFLIPSAGMVGIAAAISAIASIAIAFTHSITAGVCVSAVVVIATPAILLTMVRYWPHTPIGRRILNRRPGQLDAPTESRLRGGEKRKDLVGKIGRTITELLPGGLVRINGQKLDAISDGTVIAADTEVVVVSTTAGKIHVRVAGRSDRTPEQVEVERKIESIESTLESLDLEDSDD